MIPFVIISCSNSIAVWLAVFVCASQQFELECHFERVGWDDVIGPAFSCSAKNLNLTEPKNEITKLSGALPSGETNDKVNTFLVFEQICEFLPVGIARFFKGLEGMAIQKSGLKRITKMDLRPFKGLKSISLYGNKLQSLESNLFIFNPKIKLISLFNNELKQISANVFDGLNSIERVYMSSNPCINENAESFSKIQELRRKFIDNCPVSDEMVEYAQLEKEYLKLEIKSSKMEENLEAVGRNYLRSQIKIEALEENLEALKTSNESDSCSVELVQCMVTKTGLQQLVEELEVVEIVCEMGFDAENNLNQCNAVDLKVLKPHFRIVSVRSKNQTAIGSKEVQELLIVDQQTLYLPSNLSDFFPSLRKLSVINSGMIEFNDEALQTVEIEELNFSRNQLTEVRAKSLEKFRKLHTLDFSNNKIEKIEVSSFENLEALSELYLNDNSLSKIDSDCFSTNKNLKVLALQNNKLSQIASNFLSAFEDTVTIADFSSNECIGLKYPENTIDEILSVIKRNCTIQLHLKCRYELRTDYICNVEKLEITSNNIELVGVTGTHLKSLSNENVVDLRITNQYTKYLPSGLKKFFPHLQKVWIENSRLTEVGESFVGFGSIKELVIKNNKLTSVSANELESLLKAEVLDFSSNKISKFFGNVFQNLPHLKSINFSHNNLTTLESQILRPDNGIEFFNFSYNALSLIDPQIVKLLKFVKVIDLEGNKCIHSRYEESKNNKKKVMEIFGEVSFKCY